MTESRPKKRGGWLIAIGVLLRPGNFPHRSMLPTLLVESVGQGIGLLGMAAPSIPGEVQIDNWSLSWFGAQNIGGISYHDQGVRGCTWIPPR